MTRLLNSPEHLPNYSGWFVIKRGTPFWHPWCGWNQKPNRYHHMITT